MNCSPRDKIPTPALLKSLPWLAGSFPWLAGSLKNSNWNACQLSEEGNGGSLQMGLRVSFYTERSMFERADFQYQMMLVSTDGGEDCETINVKPETEYLIMNSSWKMFILWINEHRSEWIED